MKDVSLDDLIKEDREKNKKQKVRKPKIAPGKTAGNKVIKGRRIIKRPINNKRAKLPIKNRNFNNRPGNGQFKRRPNEGKRQILEKKQNKNKFNNRQAPNKQAPRPQKPAVRQQKPVHEKNRTLKVLGLHPDITNSDLYKLFAGQGALQKCMIQQDNFGRNLPSAIVKYHSSQHAKSSQEKFNNHKVMNSVLTVQPYKNNPNRN